MLQRNGLVLSNMLTVAGLGRLYASKSRGLSRFGGGLSRFEGGLSRFGGGINHYSNDTQVGN